MLESSGRLSRTLDRGRERSIPLSHRGLGDREAAGATDCRECSAEAENALPLGLVEGSFYSRKRSRLGFADSADQDAGWRAKCLFIKKILFLYKRNHVFENFRRFPVRYLFSPHAMRMLRSGSFGERDAYRRRS